MMAVSAHIRLYIRTVIPKKKIKCFFFLDKSYADNSNSIISIGTTISLRFTIVVPHRNRIVCDLIMNDEA